MYHIVSLETGIYVFRLMRLGEDCGVVEVIVRRKELPESEDTLDPIRRVYEDVPQMFLRYFRASSLGKTHLSVSSSKPILNLGSETGECKNERTIKRSARARRATSIPRKYNVRESEKKITIRRSGLLDIFRRLHLVGPQISSRFKRRRESSLGVLRVTE